MKSIRKITMAGLATVAVAGVVMSASPAFADPASGTYRPLAGTGSDTTQNVVNALGDVVLDGSTKVIASYDAVGSATIKTTATGPTFNRPNGSTNGLKALTASINPTGTYTWGGVNISGQLDFARSSSAPSVAGTDLTYIPFARDAVSYAYANVTTGKVPTNIAVGTSSDSASAVTLRNIYLKNVTTYTSGGSTFTYQPLLPQAGSGTRSFFLGQLGLTEAQVSTIPSVVGGTSVQENDGTLITQAGQIVPFSVASWISQESGVTTNTIRTASGTAADDVLLGSINGAAPIGSDGKLNASFPLNRLVFNVVQSSRLTASDAESVQLQDAFAGSSSGVCEATGTITAYGFGDIGSLCGNTTTYKSGYVAP